MKKINIYIVLLGIMLSSCEEFLTLAPETALSSATFYKTEADFEQAVNATYAPLRSIADDRSWLLSEMRSDNTIYARNINFGATEQQEDISDHALPEAQGITSNGHVLNQYRQDYLIIARANQILSVIDEVEFDQTSKDNLKGQALFLRGYAYYELARYFGGVPLHLDPVTAREEAALPVTPEAEIYNQLISDIQASIALLPTRSNQGVGRASKGAAQMLLADVYITQKKWAEAETLLNAIVSSGEYELIGNYEDVFSESVGNKNNIESLFEVQYLEGPEGLNGNFLYSFMPRPISPQELQPITGTSNTQGLDGEGNNIPTPDIIAAYEDGDLRKDASIAYVEIAGSDREDKVYPYIKKYAKAHDLHGNHGMSWPIYRYAEVLLFLAEALNEQGKTAEAAAYLNQIRDRAGLAATTASSQSDMREAIFKERRVEFAFENKRWFDITRADRVQEIIGAFGQRAVANPLDYYYPEGHTFRDHAFSNITKYYALPAAEAEITPHF
ncbi:RagB/SusD family nutrient uptake outer membrane protein [Cyclobacterium marinum]|uniref:RagB/SusD domain-containing protein n=1 Tax=Cyclobacterium marinum (strain ATCC 25205 / DSM 745 / LMG 13164 / NCIMB 1802) TaxID=880070 RepID=G0J114_CYCMS|nr:RagB/SusD family nutrient uptake outer membrane protein [Cyclobacterium marinum]AEL25140.1 RagB/SusD domain-containing protein [Cyclobacterium marinum DSM 745]MBI0401391.1 RagB/SusD family nutrient uptake outer membrane protein [Cyclobacterium marinum]MBR9774461.1 RagB/SusD family nutrient uptake outer membrane protein [Cytophagales bacterium]|tara:strand:- start:135934 stop:137439 length:1506 start_codon:yes stop_codon:yes gene_type:complete